MSNLAAPLPTPPPRPEAHHLGAIVASLTQYKDPIPAEEEGGETSHGTVEVAINVHAEDGTYLGNLEGTASDLTDDEKTALITIAEGVRQRIAAATGYAAR